MTDYNDGKWHIYTGGGCPVHPESLVEILHEDSGVLAETKANNKWWGSNKVIAFRVAKEHKEPREFWVTRKTLFDLDGNVVGSIYQECRKKDGLFKVQEVLG